MEDTKTVTIFDFYEIVSAIMVRALSRIRTHIIFLAWLVPLSSCLLLACNSEIFGNPSISDCHKLWDDVTANQNPRPRFFDEEQIREHNANGDWEGLQQTLEGAPNVQLPKYYSFS